jgi:hypothetical protein
MDSVSDSYRTRRITVIKSLLDTWLMELTEIEVALNAKRYPGAVESGGLERRRLLLTSRILGMDAELKQLQQRSQT